jgi:hypothetical protein
MLSAVFRGTDKLETQNQAVVFVLPSISYETNPHRYRVEEHGDRG